MKHIFIVNPTSGKGKSLTLIPKIEAYFYDKKDYEVLITEYPKHAVELASQYQASDDVCLYSVGGDGTAFEVLNGLQEGVNMAVIPVGSGNDFYRMITPWFKDESELLYKTIAGKNVQVDYGVMNDLKFLNSCCTGIDADVADHAHNVSKKIKLPRSLIYIFSAIYKITKPQKMSLTINFEDHEIKDEVILFTAMNGRYYGGGFCPTPLASLVDGVLDTVYVDFLPFLKIIPLLPKYFKGKHEGYPEIHAQKVKSFHIKSENQLIIACDGEIYYDKEMKLKIVEKGLNLRIPEECQVI